jgi:Flp pilus assembly protein CpaB
MAEPKAVGVRLLVVVGLLSAVTAAVGVTAVRRPRPEPTPTPAPEVPTVAVLVAAKDLPVGTYLDANTIADRVESKSVPQGETPAKFVTTGDTLLGKLLKRPYRAGEVFNPDDLAAGSVVTIPAGKSLYAMPVGTWGAETFLAPGVRVDMLCPVRIGGQPRHVTVVQDALVVAVEGRPPLSCDWVPKGNDAITFALDRKEALVLELAKSRGVPISLLAVNPEADARPPLDADAIAHLFEEPPEKQPLGLAPVPPAVLPKGTEAFALEFGQSTAAAGFIIPGSRVDLLATVRSGNKAIAFPAVVNVLIVAVDTQGDARGTITKFTITFAVDKPQAMVLTLAKDRGCVLSPILRAPDAADTADGYDIKKVTELLTELPSATVPVAPPPRAK